MLGLARLEDVPVIRRLDPVSIRLKLVVKSVVRGSGSAIVGSNTSLLRDRRGVRLGRGSWGALLIGQRLFARIQLGFAAGKLVLLLGLVLCVKALLHLAINLGLTLCVGLLLLTGREERKDDKKRQDGQNLFHGKR